jgi:PAS domain
MARVIKPPTFCDRLIEACRYEYKTRHLIDGRIVESDQRISIVAGYMTEEVSGLSAFTFMHRDDVRWVMVALRQSESFNIL